MWRQGSHRILKIWSLSVLKNIPPEVCYNLVKNYNKQMLSVIEAKGFTLNY